MTDAENELQVNDDVLAARIQVGLMEGAHSHFIADAPQLRRVFSKLASFMSKEETRYYLQGIYLEGAVDYVQCIATDGHRLGGSRIYQPLEGAQAIPPFTAIVPAQGVKNLLSSLKKATRVVVMVYEKEIEFDWFYQSIRMRLVQGSYPNWRLLVDENLVNDRKVTVAFDSRYLSDICKASGKAIALSIPEKTDNPTVMRDAADPHSFALLMPLRWHDAMSDEMNSADGDFRLGAEDGDGADS